MSLKGKRPNIGMGIQRGVAAIVMTRLTVVLGIVLGGAFVVAAMFITYLRST